MKKFLSSIIICLYALITLSSCQNNPVYYKTGWFYDSENHWCYLTCDIPYCKLEDKVDFGNHIDENNDRICDICDYFDENKVCEFEYVANEEGHYLHMLCSCCRVDSLLVPHSDTDNNSICDICYYKINIHDEPTNYF